MAIVVRGKRSEPFAFQLCIPALHRKSFDEEGHKCEKFPYKKETSVRL